MENLHQIDPEYIRIRGIATKSWFWDFWIIKNIVLQRRYVARMLLEDWGNKQLLDHFTIIELQIKEHLQLI